MEENILVSNIIYISSIVLCLILIIILFKQLRTTNKLLKTTQDKFHTKLSALENKYASTINTKPTTTIQTTIEETPSERYEALLNKIPVYIRKFSSAIGIIILPSIMLYVLYFTAITFHQSYLNVFAIPYLESLNKINLWSFYTAHFMVLIFVIISICVLLILYTAGGLGVMNPLENKALLRLLYNLFISIVISSYTLIYFDNYQWQIFIFTALISTTIYTFFNNLGNKLNNKPRLLISDKILSYIVSTLSILYLIIWLPISAVSVNSYFAKQAGEKEGKALLATILDDKYFKSRNHIILKATQENIYLLDCEGSECTGLRKINDDKVALAFFERKDFTFYSETKEKID